MCVLDGFGIAPGSWTSSRVAARTPTSIERFLRRSIQRFRPVAVVVGVSRRTAAIDPTLRESAFLALRTLGVPVVVRYVREAYALFRGRIRGTEREELAKTLVEGFLPDIKPQFSPKRVREHRTAWHALAVALVELLHRFPRATAALATSKAYAIPMFRSALVEADARQYPDPV